VTVKFTVLERAGMLGVIESGRPTMEREEICWWRRGADGDNGQDGRRVSHNGHWRVEALVRRLIRLESC
jgi:hypothetical protein